MCIKWRQKETTPKPTSGKNCDFSRYLSQSCCFHLQKVFSVPYRRFFQFHKYSFFEVKWQKKYKKKKKNTFPFLSLQKYLREWKWSKNLWSKLPNLYKNSTFLLVILTSMLNQRYYIHWSLSKKKKKLLIHLPAVQAAQTHWKRFRTHGWDVSRDGFHERIPLRHRFPRVLQHLQPLFASDTDEIGADRRATHQLVRADPTEGKSWPIDDRTMTDLDYSSILSLTYLS